MLHHCLELIFAAVVKQKCIDILIDTMWLHSRPETMKEIRKRTGSNTISAAHSFSRRSTVAGRISAISIGGGVGHFAPRGFGGGRLSMTGGRVSIAGGRVSIAGGKSTTLPMRALVSAGESDAGMTPRGALKSSNTMPTRRGAPGEGADGPTVSFATVGSGRLKAPALGSLPEAADPSQVALGGMGPAAAVADPAALGANIKAKLAAHRSAKEAAGSRGDADPESGAPAADTATGASAEDEGRGAGGEVGMEDEGREGEEDREPDEEGELTIGGVKPDDGADYDPLASVREEEVCTRPC